MSIDRRRFVSSAVLSGVGTTLSGSNAACGAVLALPAPAIREAADGFRFCLNTSTIREPKLGIQKEVEIAGAAGYDGIEPWIPTLREFVSGGGKLSDLSKQIADAGLTVESAIGFAQWIVDDEKRRMEALEEAKRDMDMLREIGGTRIAAPPVGAHQGDSPKIELQVVTERFRALLEIGDQTGVVPQLEVWGFSQNLSRLGEVMYVVGESGHPKACLLLDIYHLYRGGYYGLLTAREDRDTLHAVQVETISEMFGFSPQTELVYYVNDPVRGKRLAGTSTAIKKATVLTNFANGMKEDEQGLIEPMTVGKRFPEIIFIDDEDKNLKAVMHCLVRGVYTSVMDAVGVTYRTPELEMVLNARALALTDEVFAKEGVHATHSMAF